MDSKESPGMNNESWVKRLSWNGHNKLSCRRQFINSLDQRRASNDQAINEHE